MGVQVYSVTQFGFNTQAGALANLIDGDPAQFWQPFADYFDSYDQPIITDSGGLWVGFPHPAIQFDFIDRVRIPYFKVQVQGPKSLPWFWLLASDNPATSLLDTVQSGDTYAGKFSVAEMNSNSALKTLAATKNIRGRYWRFVTMKTPPLEA